MRTMLPLAFVAMFACAGDTTKTDDATTDTTAATDMTDDGMTDTTDGTSPTGDTGVDLYNITATIVDASTVQPIVDTLCGELLEISEVVLDPKNGKLTVLKTATSNKGTITFSDIDVKPSIPMLINITDCEGKNAPKEPIVGISSNTGVLPSSYADAKNGETITATAFVVTPTFLAGLQASLVAAGDTTTDLSKSGWLHGLVLDSDGSTPVAGATVTCKSCSKNPTYYLDTEAADGLFTTYGVGVNSETSAVGVWVIPAAPVSNYSATATDKTFASQLGGSFPGSVIVTAFVAEAAE